MESLGAQVLLAFLSLVVLGLILGCLVAWSYAAVGWFQGRPLLTAEARPRATWQFTEILLCVGLYLVLVIVLQGALLRPGMPAAAPPATAAGQIGAPVAPEVAPPAAPGDRPLNRRTLGLAITADGIAKVLAIAGVLIWMTLLDRRSAERLGLRLHVRDVGIGLVASAMLLPPVLAVQAVLTLLVEYEHPVLDVIRGGPGLWLGIAMAVSTVAIAPVAEEFFFRGLFQGWLQRWGVSGDAASGGDEGNGVDQAASEAGYVTADQPQSGAAELDWETAAPSVAGGGLAAADAYRPVLGEPLSPLPQISGQQVASWPWWPVVVSSGLFSLAHWGQGAAPLSLFLLAMGLGYLYRQTGRLTAPIIVHMMLNGLSTAITFVSAASGEGAAA